MKNDPMFQLHNVFEKYFNKCVVSLKNLLIVSFGTKTSPTFI